MSLFCFCMCPFVSSNHTIIWTRFGIEVTPLIFLKWKSSHCTKNYTKNYSIFYNRMKVFIANWFEGVIVTDNLISLSARHAPLNLWSICSVSFYPLLISCLKVCRLLSSDAISRFLMPGSILTLWGPTSSYTWQCCVPFARGPASSSARHVILLCFLSFSRSSCHLLCAVWTPWRLSWSFP